MDLQSITMPQEAAEAAFKEYRAAFMAERNRIDGELMRGYKALKEGKQLIRLTETITAGGVDDQGRPRLAISRCDAAEIRMRRYQDGSVEFVPELPSGYEASAASRVFTLPPATLPAISAKDWNRTYWMMWYATLPLVPPRVRPPHDLVGYHVLWEAVWHERRQQRAPRDPALLKHIGGDLYAVLAVWDLTDLERAVLEMRPQ